MPIIAGHLVKPKDADIVIYNAFDSAKTLEISHVTSAITCAHAELAYEMLLGLQAPAIEMMLRGFRVDPIEREMAVERINNKKARLDHILQKLVTAITQKPYNSKFPNSGTQLREFFYENLNLKPVEKYNRKTGRMERPMDRNALERLGDCNFYAEPFTNAVLLHRDLTGLLQDLETIIDGDGRWRCSYNLTGTTTFRWSSSKSGLGTGCVLPTTEALTPNGWVKVSVLNPGDVIAQWNKDTNQLDWGVCRDILSVDFSGDMLQVKTEQLKQTLTPNHRVVFLNSRMDTISTTTAKDAASWSQIVIPLGAEFHGDRSHARVQRKHWTNVPYTGKVYCPNVPSSYWLMREDGYISITGNSNFQNITEENRRMFIADRGWKLCGIDAEQSEARDVGWFCGTTLNKWDYLDTVEAGDCHTRVARMCWPELAWTGDLQKDRQIADMRFYRHHTRRDTTKRLAHGSNYLGKPITMATQTKIPLFIVKPFQERYFEAFPEIPEMHRWHAEKLQRDRYTVNCFGLRRDFFDRSDSDETLRSAVAHSFQSATVLRVLLGGWRIWKHMGTRVQLLSQLHDAWYFQYRLDDDEREVIKTALDHMRVVHYHKLPDGTLREFTVPNEAQTGFNWAHRWRLKEDGTKEDWNPNGLNKYQH